MANVGDVVQAYITESDEWKYAKVKRINDDGTYDVKLEGGGKLQGVTSDCIHIDAVEGEAEAVVEKKPKKEKKEKKEKKSAQSPPGSPGSLGSPKATSENVDTAPRDEGAVDVRLGRWSNYEKLGMCFDRGTGRLVLVEICEESPASRYELGKYVGWRLSHVDGVKVDTPTAVKENVGDKLTIVLRFVPLSPEEQQMFERRQVEEAAAKEAAAAPVSQSAWKADADATACDQCKANFTLTKRRHHCRQCGGVFCAGCTSQRIELKGHKERQRVCDTCHKKITKVK